MRTNPSVLIFNLNNNNSIYFDQVKWVNINVGLLDKIFKVWTILIDTGKTKTTSSSRSSGSSNWRRSSRSTTKIDYDKFRFIDKPYDVYKIVQWSLSNRKESLYSGRADRESHSEEYR